MEQTESRPCERRLFACLFKMHVFREEIDQQPERRQYESLKDQILAGIKIDSLNDSPISAQPTLSSGPSQEFHSQMLWST